jgi:acyl-CoA oxidase
VAKRRAAFDRVETLLGSRDTHKLPRHYGNAGREEQYDDGLEWGKVAFEDGLQYRHDIFDHVTPRYALANSRYALTT